MTKQTNTTLVPALRFKEFEEEWAIKELGTIGKTINGLTYSPADINNDGVLVLRSSNVQNGSLYLSDNVYVNVKKGDYNEVQLDDILICVRNGSKRLIGKNTIIDKSVEGVAFGAFMAIYRSDYNNFVYHYFSTQNYYKEIHKNLGATINSINGSDLKKFKVGFPSLPEQQKIASFLSAIDEKINQLNQKSTLLNQYKKGVMQKLFSQELRFKQEDGSDFPEWEEKKLGEVCKVYDGTHSTPKYTKTGIPFYSVEHLTANQFVKTKFISEEVWIKENKRVKLEKEDILMTRIGDIGTSRVLDWDVKASFYVSLALLKNNSNFNSWFLTQYIKSDNFQSELWKRTIHVAFPKKINLGEIGNCIVNLPCIEEQQKIANYLTELDTKLTQVNTQIEKAKAFKKGLLQQMFV